MKKALLFSLALGLAQAGLAHDNSWSGGSNQKAVFVMNNSAWRNEILSFVRQADGTLKPYGHFPTGGRGSGGTTDPLGSQGSLTLSEDHSLLFAVNAGSGDISVFRVSGPNLRLADVAASGGSAPVAVAQHGNLVYAVNFAGNSSVVGFHISPDGDLDRIPASIAYLSAANSGVSSVAFSADGKQLVVAEKLSNNIDAFPINADGTLGTRVSTKDSVAGLFLVTVIPGGALISLEAGAQAISSYVLNSNGSLTALTTGVPTMGAASCWTAVTPDGRFIYTANAGAATVSGFALSGPGMLTPIGGTVVGTLPAGSTDLDMAVSGDGKYLYTLNSGAGSVGIFAIKADGTLTLVGTVAGFTATSGANGLAAL